MWVSGGEQRGLTGVKPRFSFKIEERGSGGGAPRQRRWCGRGRCAGVADGHHARGAGVGGGRSAAGVLVRRGEVGPRGRGLRTRCAGAEGGVGLGWALAAEGECARGAGADRKWKKNVRTSRRGSAPGSVSRGHRL